MSARNTHPESSQHPTTEQLRKAEQRADNAERRVQQLEARRATEREEQQAQLQELAMREKQLLEQLKVPTIWNAEPAETEDLPSAFERIQPEDE